MAEIEGCDGVEIVYPYEVSDPKETRRHVEKIQP
jgi:putative ubiquitin-RnfH superfamily antitoxin RatB of RatAB toxin-antitoxin module